MEAHKPFKAAYLISEYPAYSVTFILREIAGLRKLGATIDTASINASSIADTQLGEKERQEKANTFYIKSQGFLGAFKALFNTLFTHPIKLMKGLFYASYLAGLNLKLQLYHFFYLLEALMVADWMKQKEATHLHVHFANPASTVAMILDKMFSIPFSITVHGPDEFYDATLNLLSEKMEKANFIVCISDYAKSQLMRLSSPKTWNKFESAPLGIDSSEYQPQLKVKSSQPIQLLNIGRLVPSKGQQILIAAIPDLHLKGKNIRLNIIGEGVDRNALEKQIGNLHLEESVKLLGAMGIKDVMKEYQHADIFVLSSFAEGVPIVLMEAMSMEIPCIAPRIHGIPELIRDGIDGLLFSPSNVKELSKAIESLINDPIKREQLGKSGRKRIQEKYDLGRNVESLYKIFNHRLKPEK